MTDAGFVTNVILNECGDKGGNAVIEVASKLKIAVYEEANSGDCGSGCVSYNILVDERIRERGTDKAPASSSYETMHIPIMHVLLNAILDSQAYISH